MLGFNGGLIGKKNAPALLNAKGVWFQNEQSVAQRDGEWPLSAADNPTAAFNPLLWYDFADSLTITTAGSPLRVTQITSKGSASRTLTPAATGPLYLAAGMNGKDCIDWGSENHENLLRNTSEDSLTISEAYVVIDAAFNGSPSGFNGLISSTVNPNYILLIGSQFLQVNAFSEAYINNGSNRFSGDVFASPSIDNRCLLRLVGTPTSWTNGFQLGQDRNSYTFTTARGWTGLMGEVIVYSSPLTTEQRTLQQNWLAAKWGISLALEG